MKLRYFITSALIISLIILGFLYLHKDKVIVIKSPPEELAKWYKPENKRQVWLHNMFKLRREMQAISLYSDLKHDQNLKKWSKDFREHYLKISTMVPSWSNKLNIEALNNLKLAVESNEYETVSKSLNVLKESCNSCHNDYRAITAAKYRAPDFNNIILKDRSTFSEHMLKLNKNVNAIKIASSDGFKEVSIKSVNELEAAMYDLGATCLNCHKQSKQIYPDESIKLSLTDLKNTLKSGTLKQQGRTLGTLAVQACANCHSIHRLSFDIKSILNKNSNWLSLAKHNY